MGKQPTYAPVPIHRGRTEAAAVKAPAIATGSLPPPRPSSTLLGMCKNAGVTDMAILAELTSDDVLDTAYDWLCDRRRNYPADADVWSFRQQWPVEKDRLKVELSAGRDRFGLLTRITLADGEEVDLWSARDALVLKALTILLADVLPVSARSGTANKPNVRVGS